MSLGRAWPEVVVTGLGLITPAGVGVEKTWKQVCGAAPTAAADPELAGLPVDFSCRVPEFDGPPPARLDRHARFALTAAREALAHAGLDPAAWDGARVGIVLASAAGGIGTLEAQHRRVLGSPGAGPSPLLLPMFLPNMAAGALAIEFDARGPCLHVSTACASGTTAIGTALRLLRADDCDIVLAGGAEAMITPLCAAGFAKLGALSRRRDDPGAASRPFDVHRDGFVLGEGAGVLVLERSADARARAASPLAVVAGYGATADARNPVAPDPEGRGAEAAIHRALADAGAAPADVDHVNAHATGTPVGDRVEAAALHRILGERPTVTSIKGVTGHTLGAAGAIEAAVTVLTISRGLVPPIANLSDPDPEAHVDLVMKAPRSQSPRLALSESFGFGGQNAVIAISAP